MGPTCTSNGVDELSRYLLDTTTLIAHLRGDEAVHAYLLELLTDGHTLCTTCVNIAEVERGLGPSERKRAAALLDRLDFLRTTVEAGRRAGRYMATFQARGVTIHTPDALIAGTARVHGAILVTDNLSDFPMSDLSSHAPPSG